MSVENLNAAGEPVRETQARRKIRVALEVRGATVISIRWEPIGQMIEMSGREGGWDVWARMPGKSHEESFQGYALSDVLDGIDCAYPAPGSSERGEG